MRKFHIKMIPFLIVSYLTVINGNRLRDIRRMEGKIVGGEEVEIEEVPHAAFLSISCVREEGVTKFQCGASVLNQVTLITAAHCLYKCKPSTTIKIVTGSKNKKSSSEMSAKRFVVHPEYDYGKDLNDLALIKLADPIEFGPKTKRVLLLKDPPKNYNKIFVSGWGLVNEETNAPAVLLKGSEQILIGKKECSKLLTIPVPDGTICTKGKKGTHFGFASRGDSGGGLVLDDYILIGVVSFKEMNDDTRHIVVYADVTYYYDWITEISKDFLCSD